MSWYVYMIKSGKDGSYYKGITEDIERRLLEHNSGLSNYTSTKMPWNLVYYKGLCDKRTAIIEEKRIKRLNIKSLERLIGMD